MGISHRARMVASAADAATPASCGTSRTGARAAACERAFVRRAGVSPVVGALAGVEPGLAAFAADDLIARERVKERKLKSVEGRLRSAEYSGSCGSRQSAD